MAAPPGDGGSQRRTGLQWTHRFPLPGRREHHPRYTRRVNVQIFGTKKCADTRKAERFFRERKIAVHLVDLAEKGMA